MDTQNSNFENTQSIHFDIVIPHYKHTALLEKTLRSIVEAIKPNSLREIHVIENGIKSGAENVCAKFRNELPIHYHDEPSVIAA